MQLVIDIGNTRAKIALFKKDVIWYKVCAHQEWFNVSLQLLEDYPQVNYGIYTAVGPSHQEQISQLKNKIKLFQLSHSLELPFQNLYKSPKTLGTDRIALVAGAIKKFPKKNALIIDAGSCITYDFVDQHRNYLGGSISPGIRLRYKSLNQFTDKLPLLNTEAPKCFIGTSTQESIHTGIVGGIIDEMDGKIKSYRDEFSILTIILTGGDAEFLSNKLKSSIFVDSKILLEGLNFILINNKG